MPPSGHGTEGCKSHLFLLRGKARQSCSKEGEGKNPWLFADGMEQEILAMWVQTLISGVGLIAILVGLVRMKEAGARRDREIDERAAAFRKQGAALEDQGTVLRASTQALAELLRRTA